MTDPTTTTAAACEHAEQVLDRVLIDPEAPAYAREAARRAALEVQALLAAERRP